MNKNIGDILREGELKLKKSGNIIAAEESVLLLSYLLNKKRFDILLDRTLCPSLKDIKTYHDWIDKRSKGIPLQYITGFQNFMGLEFKVNEGVFIPRPETEILIEEIIKIISSMPDKKKLSFLDIGVGSGIIPITICHHFQKSKKNIHFYAVDISKKAIELAKENAKRFNCEESITFCQGNIFAGLKSLNTKVFFNGIISNPPYIGKDELDKLPGEIYFHEPKEALDGGEEGLDYYREIISQSTRYLKERNSFLALEIGHKQKDSICEIIKRYNFDRKKISVIQDYYHNDRVIIAYKKI